MKFNLPKNKNFDLFCLPASKKNVKSLNVVKQLGNMRHVS